MFLTPSGLGDVFLLFILALMAGHAWWLYTKGRWLMLDPLNAFWGGVTVCYVQQALLGGDIFISWHSQAVFNKTLFAIFVGLFFVIVGYELQTGVRFARMAPQLPPRINDKKMLLAALLIMVLGVAGYVWAIKVSGGLSAWLSVGRGGTDYEQVQGFLAELPNLLPGGVALLLFRANLHKDRVSLFWVMVAWLVAGLMWLWFLYLGSRSRMIGFSLVMLAAYYVPRRRNPRLVLAIGVFLVLQILVPFQANYRYNFTNLSFHLESIDKQELYRTILPEFLGGDRRSKRAQIDTGAELNCVMAVVELVPDKVPYNYGYGFLQIFTGPIPRALWPNKIYPHLESIQGVLSAGNLSSSFNNNVNGKNLLMGPAFTFTGHWYYVGGFLGLVIGGLITGILLRTIRSCYDIFPANESFSMLYPFLISIGFTEAAATPWRWTATLPLVLLPFLLLFYLCREDAPLRRSIKSKQNYNPPNERNR